MNDDDDTMRLHLKWVNKNEKNELSERVQTEWRSVRTCANSPIGRELGWKLNRTTFSLINIKFFYLG